MAGDWIKFDTSTPDKPEVWAIAAELEIDPDAVVGKLLRVWIWFDDHSENGNAPSVTKTLLDRCVGVTGFVTAMVKVGWMLEEDGTISVPHFDRHNGQTAKTRALTAKRVAACKAKGNAGVTPEPLPREEKRREEKNKKESSSKLRFDEWDMEFAKTMFSKILEVAPKEKEPNLPKWANELRLMREQDKRTPAEIDSVFRWANRDAFWRTNVLCPAKLRSQFAALDAKMRNGKTNHNEPVRPRPLDDEELKYWTPNGMVYPEGMQPK